jgi:hypothetical protein
VDPRAGLNATEKGKIYVKYQSRARHENFALYGLSWGLLNKQTGMHVDGSAYPIFGAHYLVQGEISVRKGD